jgi:hypothetical protein
LEKSDFSYLERNPFEKIGFLKPRKKSDFLGEIGFLIPRKKSDFLEKSDFSKHRISQASKEIRLEKSDFSNSKKSDFLEKPIFLAQSIRLILKEVVLYRLVFLGLGEKPPRFNLVANSSFWGQLFGRHSSTLSSTRLFGARFSAATLQLCRRINRLFGARREAAKVQLFQPPRLRFVIDSLGLVQESGSFHTTSANRFRLLSRGAIYGVCRRPR